MMAIELSASYSPPIAGLDSWPRRLGDEVLSPMRAKGMATNIVNNHQATTHAASDGPDAHGQAALLLVESLIHMLVARTVISVEEAIEVVETAAEVKAEVAESLGDSPDRLRHSLTLLRKISHSLSQDLP
ncbi:hypothetical protein [Aquibium oceanicum]|uniref:Uncharacterized protein n=1 Tax=Aquibium oceanicum TaxID=1670800 RepID=A0A1L3STX8_9HYPH|nr:hypothetical protein [Aquibium oceanicum]APH72844.1 hypothetical protein BSQ44_16815 [Aquibium oceanicum]